MRAAEALAGLIALDDSATGRDLVRGTSTLTDEGMTPVVDAKQLSKAVSNLLRGGARRRASPRRGWPWRRRRRARRGPLPCVSGVPSRRGGGVMMTYPTQAKAALRQQPRVDAYCQRRLTHQRKHDKKHEARLRAEAACAVYERAGPPGSNATDTRGLLSAKQAEDEHVLGAKLAHALGYRRPSKQRGIRILALDGGGSRGVVTVQLLKQLQQVAFPGKEPSDVFDLVVGTSTGAILALLLGTKHCSLATAEKMYELLLDRIFVKEELAGEARLLTRRARYDEKHIERVFDELLGDDELLGASGGNGPDVALLALC